MKERDQLKQTTKDLARRDQGGDASNEQQSAWKEFEKIRNKVNNKKRQDENKFKSSKIASDLDSPSKVWATPKDFMGWKTTGTLEVNNKLECS